jgi:hypothetical protein
MALMRCFLFLCCLVQPVAAWAQTVLDVAAAPGLDATGRAEYGKFLIANLPRAFAVSNNGRAGWAGPAPSPEVARSVALERCAAVGGTGCALYAVDLDVVWPGRPAWRHASAPGPLLSTGNYAFVPDERFFWHGPQAAAGAYVWSHGKGPAIDSDNRGLQPPAHVRPFNNAGFDVVRFDRAPLADDPNRAAGWLADGLAALRRMGYRRIIAGGESRGGWTSLQMLDEPKAADVVIAFTPGAHGTAASTLYLTGADDLRSVVRAADASTLRLAVVQFAADPFAGDLDDRAQLFGTLRGRIGALLLLDRPPGFTGHGAASSEAFAERYGACLLRFATSPAPPGAC